MKSMTRRSLAVVLAVLMVFSTMMVGMITANAATQTTIYFDNSVTKWSKVNCYYWGGESTAPSWPGTAMTKGTGDIWSITLSATPGSVIFNNGSSQSADLTYPGDGYTAKPNSASGKFTVTWSKDGQVATEPTTTDYYVAGEAGLCGVAWNEKADANKMTANADGSYEKVYSNVAAGTYKFKITNGTWNNALSNGSANDNDGNSAVTVDKAGSTVTIKLTSDLQVVSSVAPPTQASSQVASSSQAASSEAPVETITILYTDTLGWDKVNVHYWNEAGLTSKWPGVEMTFKGTNDFQQKQYTAEIPAAAEKMIFNNGTDQLAEVAVDATATGYYYDADAQAVKTWTEEPASSEPASSEPASSEPASSEPASSEPVVGDSTFYVVGSFTDWQTDDAYKLTKNTAAEVTEYSISGLELKKDDEFKVVETNGSIQGFTPVWYPDGIDNNYVVAEDGTYTVYFRPDYNGGEDWFNNCIYAAKEETPQPTVKKGDVNGDNEVNGADLTYLRRYLAEWENYEVDARAADVNGDGEVNGADLTYLRRYLAEWEGYTLD